MFDSVLVIQSKLNLNNSLSVDQVKNYSNLYFVISENEVTLPTYEWIDARRLEDEMTRLLNYLKSIHNKLRGDIFVSTRDKDGNISQWRYKFSGNKFGKESCEFVLQLKHANDGDKRKALSDDEKVQLFREYWDAKHVVPMKSETYKGFRIGAYYSTISKNDAMMDVLTTIMTN